jgi:glycine hydroxymethyltransferase
MDEIAGLIDTVLAGTSAAPAAKGGLSKANYVLADGLAERVAGQAADLVAGFPLYPSVDLT